MKRERLDRMVLERGITTSRERARALIMEGRILVNGIPVTKPGTLIEPLSEIILKGEDIPYVSRGGLKLHSAMEYFNIDVKDLIVMDVGSSTGGFTDCLLQHGARKVYCIDVGYGQLAWKLRNDSRVVLFERTNIRYLKRETIPEVIDLITIDVSFISLKKVIPHVREFLRENGEILALIKPQFEVGKGEVGKGGIVRDGEKRESAVESIRDFVMENGFKVIGIFESSLKGQKGNIEYFIYMRRVDGRTEADRS